MLVALYVGLCRIGKELARRLGTKETQPRAFDVPHTVRLTFHMFQGKPIYMALDDSEIVVGLLCMGFTRLLTIWCPDCADFIFGPMQETGFYVFVSHVNSARITIRSLAGVAVKVLEAPFHVVWLRYYELGPLRLLLAWTDDYDDVAVFDCTGSNQGWRLVSTPSDDPLSLFWRLKGVVEAIHMDDELLLRYNDKTVIWKPTNLAEDPLAEDPLAANWREIRSNVFDLSFCGRMFYLCKGLLFLLPEPPHHQECYIYDLERDTIQLAPIESRRLIRKVQVFGDTLFAELWRGNMEAYSMKRDAQGVSLIPHSPYPFQPARLDPRFVPSRDDVLWDVLPNPDMAGYCMFARFYLGRGVRVYSFGYSPDSHIQ